MKTPAIRKNWFAIIPAARNPAVSKRNLTAIMSMMLPVVMRHRQRDIPATTAVSSAAISRDHANSAAAAISGHHTDSAAGRAGSDAAAGTCSHASIGRRTEDHRKREGDGGDSRACETGYRECALFTVSQVLE